MDYTIVHFEIPAKDVGKLKKNFPNAEEVLVFSSSTFEPQTTEEASH